MSQTTIRPEFQVHMLNDAGKAQATQIAEVLSEALNKLEAIVGSGRELAIVKTKLEEACFFAKRGMASKPENRLCQNSCEHCDEAAPAGKRFCSDACQIADQPSA